LAKKMAQFHDRPEICGDPFKPVLTGQSVGQPGQIAHVITKGRGGELDIPFEDGRINFPTRDQLKNILGGEKILMDTPIPPDPEDRPIDLRFERDFDLDITPDRCQAGGRYP
jgi:hypothetical protein